MLVMDETNNALYLDSIHVPTVATHFWALDLTMRDFTLTPIELLEELPCPSLALVVDGVTVSIPSSWMIMCVDKETSQIDLIDVHETAGRHFFAAVYDNSNHRIDAKPITVVDYSEEDIHVYPMINRHHMLCHPISHNSWIMVSPNDTYNKYLKNCLIGDLI